MDDANSSEVVNHPSRKCYRCGSPLQIIRYPVFRRGQWQRAGQWACPNNCPRRYRPHNRQSLAWNQKVPELARRRQRWIDKWGIQPTHLSISQNYYADREEIEAWAKDNQLQVVWTPSKYTTFTAIDERIFDAFPGESLVPMSYAKALDKT